MYSADVAPKPTHPATRFWDKVRIGEAHVCWEWTGARHPLGYGFLHAGKLYRGGKRFVSAPRLSWEIHHGELVPDGMDVLHSCDNPPCVNPAHLHLGTQGDNNRERSARGRGRENRPENRGELSPISKVTEADVRAIVAAVEQGATQSSQARKYGLSVPHVYRLVHKQSWKHLWE
jgi:hypothetical protein